MTTFVMMIPKTYILRHLLRLFCPCKSFGTIKKKIEDYFLNKYFFHPMVPPFGFWVICPLVFEPREGFKFKLEHSGVHETLLHSPSCKCKKSNSKIFVLSPPPNKSTTTILKTTTTTKEPQNNWVVTSLQLA